MTDYFNLLFVQHNHKGPGFNFRPFHHRALVVFGIQDSYFKTNRISEPLLQPYLFHCLAKVLRTGQTKNWTMSVSLSVFRLSDMKHCQGYNRSCEVSHASCPVRSINICYCCTSLPDKLSAEDRSFSNPFLKCINCNHLALCYGVLYSVSKEMHLEFIGFPFDPGLRSSDPGWVIFITRIAREPWTILEWVFCILLPRAFAKWNSL